MKATRTPDLIVVHRPACWLRNLATACLGVIMLLGGPAMAQKFCIPTASGVPALSGAPNFLDTSASGPAQYWPRLDDPRWIGAMARSFGTGASQEASFRALRVDGTKSAIYLSWFVPVDSQLDPSFDFVRVAFSPGGGATDVMIDVIPFTSVAASIQAGVPTSTQTRTLSGTTWTNVGAEPAWVGQNTRVWLDKDTQMWAVNMRVPVSATATFDTGIRMSPTFNMAFDMQVSQAGGTVVYYRFKDTIALNNLSASAATTPSGWSQMSIEPAPSGCAKGVSITSSNVGTTYVDSGSVARPNRISIAGPNTFFALPTNETGGPVGATSISGTFRIANWGSQPDWNDIPNPTTSLWKQLNTTLVTNAGSISNGATASVADANAMTFAWTPSHNEKCELVGKSGVPANQTGDGVAIPGDPSCPNANPTRRLHQCILVELSGGGFTYIPPSIYRNMDYVNASTFERAAEISVAGLAPGGGVPRDVYLYLQTFQMPPNVGAPPASPTLVNYQEVLKILSKPRGDNNEPTGAAAGTPPQSSSGGGQSPFPTTPPASGDLNTFNQVYPTYLVHAYRDTGTTVTVGGKTLKVLKSQSSFGYYVHHDGALDGWDATLDGAQLIAPHYYKIGVPEGGTVSVTTKVVARENGHPKWLWWLIALIVLVLLVLFFRRKAKP